MMPHGIWEFTGHAYPGRPRIFLKYAGSNQKQVLTDEVRKRGVRIENHLTLTEVIARDGEVIGAIGVGIKDERPVLKIFRAKCVVLTTGTANRLYPAPSPGWMFNTAFLPEQCGGGRAMAFRAGAKLVNMEFRIHMPGRNILPDAGKPPGLASIRTLMANRSPFCHKAYERIGRYHRRCLELRLP